MKKEKINEDIIDQMNDEELEKRFDIIVHNMPRYKSLPAGWDDPKDDIYWDEYQKRYYFNV